MKKTLVLLSFCLSTLFIQAQTNTKREKIQKLLELSGAGKVGIQVINQMMTGYKSTYSHASQQFWDDFKKEVKAEDIVNLVIPVYEKHYSEQDIEQLIIFYKSPIGQKTIAVTPLITHESMIAGQKLGTEIGKKVIEKLKENGFLEN
jgi:pyruvate-formate lyase-activating enzyme